MCKSICEIVLAVVMVVLGLLPLAASVHKWALVVVGLVLLLHAILCKKCCCNSCEVEKPAKPKRRR